ncbi:DUF167 domain-containing protein [bacterium]
MKINIKVTANAKKNEFCGMWEHADGKIYYKVKIKALAKDGKANEELISFFAKQLGLAKSKIQIVSGEHSSLKVLDVFAEEINIMKKFRR